MSEQEVMSTSRADFGSALSQEQMKSPSEETTGLMKVSEEALSQWMDISLTPLFEGQNDILPTVCWGLDPPQETI